MKTMTCKQLGGSCNFKFRANTFKEIAEQSKKHGMEMLKSGDKEHLKAMEEMQKLTQSSEDMAKWFENKRKEFENLPKSK